MYWIIELKFQKPQSKKLEMFVQHERNFFLQTWKYFGMILLESEKINNTNRSSSGRELDTGRSGELRWEFGFSPSVIPQKYTHKHIANW